MVHAGAIRAAGAAGAVLRRRGGMLGGGALLALLAWRLGTGPFLDAVHVVSGRALAVALVIGGATTVLSAWRWAMVARGLGMRLPLSGAICDYYRSLFLNSVLPGGVLGDVHRAVRHGRDVGDVPLAVKAVVLERAAGQIVLMVIGVAVVLTGRLPLHAPSLGPDGRLAVAAVIMAALLGALALGPGAPARWRGSRAAGALRTWAADARRGLLSRGSWAGILLTSAAVLAGHLVMFVVAARAAGSTTSVLRLAPLLLLALVAMAVPLNIGGWGPREAATTWAFATAGLNAAQGLTMAVVYGLLALVASLPGAAVLVGQRIVASRARRALEIAEAGPPAVPALAELTVQNDLIEPSELVLLTCEVP